MRAICPDCRGRVIPAGTVATCGGVEQRRACRDCGLMWIGGRFEDVGGAWSMWG